MRSTRSRSRWFSASTDPLRYSRPAAADAAPGMSGKPPTQPRSAVSSGVQRTSGRTARIPTPAGPPQSRAEAARTSHAWGTGSCPITCTAWTSRGTPASRARAATSASGWRVPTSALAAWTHASAVGRDKASSKAARSRRPRVSTETRSTCVGPLLQWAQYGHALDRAGNGAPRGRPRRSQEPLDGHGHRGRAGRGEEHVLRPDTEGSGDAGPGGVEDHPRPTTGVVQARGVAPGLVGGRPPGRHRRRQELAGRRPHRGIRAAVPVRAGGVGSPPGPPSRTTR